jgi:hypothetical protein
VASLTKATKAPSALTAKLARAVFVGVARSEATWLTSVVAPVCFSSR